MMQSSDVTLFEYTCTLYQDERSLMWMSAVQDYVKSEPSVTYLQVRSLKLYLHCPLHSSFKREKLLVLIENRAKNQL